MTERFTTQFLRLALWRAARGTGSSPTLYQRRTALQPIPDLEQILGSTAWVLVGGIALRAYIPERMTLDIAILIHERDADVARDALFAAGYRMLGQLSIGGFSAQLPAPASAPLDVLTRSDSWLEGALASPMRDTAGHPVLARPYLLLLKLQAGRTQDPADVQRLLATATASERIAMRSLIEHHSPGARRGL